jgi:hypothetical protein
MGLTDDVVERHGPVLAIEGLVLQDVTTVQPIDD